jgi:hypothetical protein
MEIDSAAKIGHIGHWLSLLQYGKCSDIVCSWSWTLLATDGQIVADKLTAKHHMHGKICKKMQNSEKHIYDHTAQFLLFIYFPCLWLNIKQAPYPAASPAIDDFSYYSTAHLCSASMYVDVLSFSIL